MRPSPRLTNFEARAFVARQNTDEQLAESRRELLVLGLVLVGLAACGVLGLVMGVAP